MGLRATQFSLTVFGVMAVVDIAVDVFESWKLYHTGFGTQNNNTKRNIFEPFFVHLAIVTLSGIVEACVLVDVRRSPLRFLLSIGRLNVVPDTVKFLVKPTYETLHPQFTHPTALWIQSCTKAIPLLLLQTYLSLSFEPTLDDQVVESQFSGVLIELVKGCASVAFALASFEVGDFKERQVLIAPAYNSWRFVSLFLYRFVELMGRLLVLLMLRASCTPSEVAAFVITDLCLLTLMSRRFSGDGLGGAFWQEAALFFVFWDNPTKATTPTSAITLKTTPLSSGGTRLKFEALIGFWRYHVLRGGETLFVVMCVYTDQQLHEEYHELVVAWGVCSMVVMVLLPVVKQNQWCSASKINRRLAAPVSFKATTMSTTSTSSTIPTTTTTTTPKTKTTPTTRTRTRTTTLPKATLISASPTSSSRSSSSSTTTTATTTATTRTMLAGGTNRVGGRNSMVGLKHAQLIQQLSTKLTPTKTTRNQISVTSLRTPMPHPTIPTNTTSMFSPTHSPNATNSTNLFSPSRSPNATNTTVLFSPTRSPNTIETDWVSATPLPRGLRSLRLRTHRNNNNNNNNNNNSYNDNNNNDSVNGNCNSKNDNNVSYNTLDNTYTDDITTTPPNHHHNNNYNNNNNNNGWVGYASPLLNRMGVGTPVISARVQGRRKAQWR